MIEDVKKFIYGIKKRGVSSKGSIYAQIIKGERARQHKTLEEVAKGICSVSYLCKMENYSINPPINFVKTLFERMNLDYNAVSDEDFEFSLNNALCYYYEENDALDLMVERISKYDSSPSIKLIMCLYYLKHYEYDKLNDELTFLDEIKDTLGGLEALTLVYLALKYYIDVSHFDRAYQYLKCLDFIDVENKYLKFLLLDANLISSFHMKNYFRFVTYFNKIDLLEYSGYSFTKRIEAKMMYNVFRCLEYKNVVLEEVLADEYFLEGVIYYNLIVKIKCGLYDEVYNKIINDYKLNHESRFIGLLAYCAYRSNNNSYYQDILKITNTFVFKDCDKIHKNFIFFVLMIGHKINNLEIKDYLKKEFVPVVNKYYNYLYDEIYKEVYIKILGESSQYKEGFNFLINYYKDNYYD